MRLSHIQSFKLSLFIVLISFGFGVFVLSLNYVNYPNSGWIDYIQILLHWLGLVIGCASIIGLLSMSRWLFAVSFPLFVVVSSIAAYFKYQFDITFNYALFESVLNTNIGEAKGLISGSLIFYVISVFVVSVIAIVMRLRMKVLKRDRVLSFSILIVSAFIFSTINSKRNNTYFQRIPFSIYSSWSEYQSSKIRISENRVSVASGAVCNSDSLVVVLVIGEALRADHVGMNGYKRETMPNMKSRNVVSMPHVYSPYTHTNRSIPYMLTRAEEANLEPIGTECSLFDFFNHVGFYTSWISNQIPASLYEYFVNENDTVVLNKPYLTEYSTKKKLDSDLVPIFNAMAKKPDTLQLVTLQLMGNHWWYNSRFPDTFAVYKPILKNKRFSKELVGEMVNSYDNATLFSDFVLEQMISTIEGRNAILIFISDHGQSFGENGKWLHANDEPVEKNPAAFVWMSEKYKEKFPERVLALSANSLKNINTSFLFHSVLAAASIDAETLDQSNNIFSLKFQE